MGVIAFLQANPLAFAAIAGGLGLLVGSFLNVVIHRLPIMMEREWRAQCRELLEGGEASPASLAPGEAEPYNLMAPRSSCPSCGARVSASQNIPVLSYLMLRGRCAACAAPIPARYPIVEALTGILSAAVAWHFGFGVAAAGALVLTWALVALTFIDLDHQLLPDSITLPLLWLGLGLSLFAVFADVRTALIGAMAGYGVLWLVFQGFRLLTGKEGMGYGDFKLTAMLGGWLGWPALPAIIVLSSLAGAVVGLALILGRGHDRSRPIPFGPYLAAAGWICLMWGPGITEWYLRLSGLA